MTMTVNGKLTTPHDSFEKDFIWNIVAYLHFILLPKTIS